MESSVKKVEGLLDGNTKYFIPPYQRPYRWDPENAEQLVQDVYESYQSKEDKYFIGSMICIEQEGGFEVVDGQQRLITLTLILKQLSELINEGRIKIDLQKKILWTETFTGYTSPAVKVRKNEHEFYLNILEGKGVEPKTNTEKVFSTNQSEINTFLTTLSQNELEKLAKHLLTKVLIVFVVADDRMSSFRLFNVLNDRGVGLNDADLLKNFLFGEVSGNKDRSRQVEKKWQQIEDLVGEQEIGTFFLLHIHSEKINRDRVVKIKGRRVSNFEYCQHQLRGKFDGDAVRMLDALIKSAENYDEILNGGPEIKKSIAFMLKLSGAKLKEWFPALLAFLNKRGHTEEFFEFAKLMEKIYAQSCLRKLTSGQRDKACYLAIEAINRDESFPTIMESIKDCVDNQKFEESLNADDFYDGSRRQIIVLVKSVLMKVDAEREDGSVEKNYTGKITVEHILPQNMNDPYWINLFTKEQHEKWKNKLGNLTLISGAKNSSAKNFGFDKKKESYNRLNQKCSFEITKEICELPEWNMRSLKDRHDKLKKEMKKLWFVD